MSRWHNESCTDPDVVLDEEKVPHCRACGERAQIESLLSSLNTSHSIPKIPPDKPIGQLKLHWPPSITFERSQARDGPGGIATALATRNGDSDVGDKPAVKSPVYENTLRPDEIRLIELPPVSHDQLPIHLTLVSFPQDNCPEYEAMSYTWGGEDGDSSRSKPIFVGRYWDVLFQTKNCFEMLRFARPWRGTRVIWVDALCINQDNLKERGVQVAKMNQIFSQAVRVVVYLGPDIAQLTPGRFAPRRPLHMVEDGNTSPTTGGQDGVLGLRVQDILRRRYFSRIWVIQELVLAHAIIVRIGQTDFWMNAMTARDLQGNVHDWDWSNTPAPWAQNVGQGHLEASQIVDLMHLTSQSQSTDPRDKLFGALSLISNIEERGALTPDYGLSFAEVCIGLSAHCIVNLKMWTILQMAQGITGLGTSPSWIPRHLNSWADFKPRVVVGLGLTWDWFLNHYDTSTIWPYVRQLYWLYSDEDSHRAMGDRTWDHDITINADTGALSIYLTRICTLLARARRIAEYPASPQYGSGYGFYEVAQQDSLLYLVSKFPLDDLVQPKEDNLFLLNAGETGGKAYLILRRLQLGGEYKFVAFCYEIFLVVPHAPSEGTGDSSENKESLDYLNSPSLNTHELELVARDVSLSQQTDQKERQETGDLPRRKMPGSKPSLQVIHVSSLYRSAAIEFDMLRDAINVEFLQKDYPGHERHFDHDFYLSFRKTHGVSLDIRNLLQDRRTYSRLFPSVNRKALAAFEMYCTLLDRRSRGILARVYGSSISKRVSQDSNKGFFSFSLVHHEWPRWADTYTDDNLLSEDKGPEDERSPNWEIRLAGSVRWESATTMLGRGWRVLENPMMDVRVPTKQVREWLEVTFEEFHEHMTRLQEVLGIEMTEVASLIRHGPREEHRYIGCPDSLNLLLLSGLEIDGSTFKVAIS